MNSLRHILIISTDPNKGRVFLDTEIKQCILYGLFDNDDYKNGRCVILLLWN